MCEVANSFAVLFEIEVGKYNDEGIRHRLQWKVQNNEAAFAQYWRLSVEVLGRRR